MITLYTWTTPNGRKISILLEELGLPYRLRPVNIDQREQFDPAFLKVSPNNKIPAIVDDDVEGGPLTVFESGAILTYLAEKTGCLLAPSGRQRYEAIEWLHWGIGGLGPMLGQLVFFALHSHPEVPVAIKRFTTESDRLLGVLDSRLARSQFLGGDRYSIADIAAYPWASAASTLLGGVLAESLSSKPALHEWLQRVGERPAVRRGMAVPSPGAGLPA